MATKKKKIKYTAESIDSMQETLSYLQVETSSLLSAKQTASLAEANFLLSELKALAAARDTEHKFAAAGRLFVVMQYVDEDVVQQHLKTAHLFE
jgi:predicted glutamine amidotransferase